MPFTEEQISELTAPLSRNTVKTRIQAGRTLSYVEAWHVIAEANRIFGFDAWSSETLEMRCVAERERTIGEQKRPGWGVTYVARVRICVSTEDSHHEYLTRDGTGSGHGIDADLGLAHESGSKEAESDARKRALMTFGNPFGLALYDKQQSNVANEGDIERQKFIEHCEREIARLGAMPDKDLVLIWWNSDSEKLKRRDFELTQDEVDRLRNLIRAARTTV